MSVGTSGMNASRIALGVMRMDALERGDAANVLDTVLGRGVNFFDTADIYGFGAGRAHASSRKFGMAMKDTGVVRSDIFIQTKFGIVIDYADGGASRYDSSIQHLGESLDRELDALGTDYVDSVLLHRPDPLIDADEFADAIDGFIASGTVRHVGVSNMDPRQIEYLQASLKVHIQVDQLQFGLMHTPIIDAGMHVNMSDADAVNREGDILPYARLRNITVQAWSPFQSGTRYGAFVGNPHFPELNRELDRQARKHGTTANAVAAAWVLYHPAMIQLVLGSMNPGRLSQMIDGDAVQLERQDWWDLYKAAGHRIP
ncbi:aldo/keto reductase [Bifidobacterium sp.]|uniref:aldo/keto reductase n=1 Tax=Bifidobacterium sp. TaxID=41200 RepID=UPI0025C48AEF|nr:aldo/keto reductase [Bifidobacterium sp.]MCH4209976.1 aldo/keto reductase [Bifidobacterium sp.]MCI1225547.1 aldo/keto reductase [Bifidobacterium sp.]